MKLSIKSLVADSVFMILFSIIVYNAYIKITSYISAMSMLQPQLQSIEQAMLDNFSNFDFTALNLNLELINHAVNSIILATIIAISLIYIIFVLTQSFSFSKKISFDYMKKFSIITIPFFIILIFLFYKLMLNLKEVLESYLFNSTLIYSSLLISSIYICTLLFVIHTASLFYSYSINNALKKTVIKTISSLKSKKVYFMSIKYFLAILVVWVVAIRYFGTIFQIISLILIIILINFYKNSLPR